MIRRLLFLSYMLFLPFQLFPQTIRIWGENPEVKKMKRSELTAYMAGEENNKGVAVIVCPGGSYCYLGMKQEGHQVAEWLQSQGISAFVLRYRVGMHGNRHPAMIQDLQRAIQIVREDYTSSCGIDPCKIGIMGFSAGGHLVGTAGTYSGINFMKDLGIEPDVSLRPDFVSMIYPVVSMTDSIAHKKSRRFLLGGKSDRELRKMMSLEQNVHRDIPPTFIVHCKGDKTVDYRNAVYYKQALKEKDIPCQFTLYDEKGHGFGINPKQGKGEAPTWNEQFIPWLQEIEIL